MTAALLRRLQLQQLAAALLVGAWLGWRGHPAAAVAVALLGLPAGYAVVTAAQVLNSALWCWRHGEAPRWAARLRTWLVETGLQARAFAWLQPWRAHAWPDHATGHCTGVLLVHGHLCNRGTWNPLLARLSHRGTPFIAVDLEPTFGDIAAYATRVEQGVARLHAATGCAPVVLAHSMGGLAVRAWLAAAQGNGGRVAHVIYLGSPHHGSEVARLAPSINAVQMRPGSRWLRELEAREAACVPPPSTCVAAGCDQLVFPPRAALLAGARELLFERAGHMELAAHPRTWALLVECLDDPG